MYVYIYIFFLLLCALARTCVRYTIRHTYVYAIHNIWVYVTRTPAGWLWSYGSRVPARRGTNPSEKEWKKKKRREEKRKKKCWINITRAYIRTCIIIKSVKQRTRRDVRYSIFIFICVRRYIRRFAESACSRILYSAVHFSFFPPFNIVTVIIIILVVFFFFLFVFFSVLPSSRLPPVVAPRSILYCRGKWLHVRVTYIGPGISVFIFICLYTRI